MGAPREFDFSNKSGALSPSAPAPILPAQRGPPRNGPVASWRAGAINVSVWQNETTTAEGKVQSYQTVSFERRYKDKNGEWKSTNSMNAQDVPKAIVLLQEAYKQLLLGGEHDE